MKLSIVLTVYNKEPYLRRALEALLAQVDVCDGEYEVLAVNDGSNDGSASILEEYAKRDAKVRILTQENQGLSMARNNGTKAAQGEYLWYVDADDTLSSRAVRMICDAIEERPDVIPIYAKTDGIETIRNRISPFVKTGRDILLNGAWEPCGVFYILNKRFLLENNLKFLPGIYHEDSEFTPRMLYVAQSVLVLPEVLYQVYRDPNSITQVLRPKRAFDYIIVAENLGRFVVEQEEEKTLVGTAIYSSASVDINNSLYIIMHNGREYKESYNRFFYNKRYYLIKCLSHSSLLKYRIESILFRLFPLRYVEVYKLLNVFH